MQNFSCLPARLVYLGLVMKTLHSNTILFNIAARTCLKISPKDEGRVKSYIMAVMNGDGLYDNASEEVILEAYFNQNQGGRDITWAHLIVEALDDLHGCFVD